MKTILVATDFSKNSLNAVKYALMFSKISKARIILFNSYEDSTGEFDLPFSGQHYGKNEAMEGAEGE